MAKQHTIPSYQRSPTLLVVAVLLVGAFVVANGHYIFAARNLSAASISRARKAVPALASKLTGVWEVSAVQAYDDAPDMMVKRAPVAGEKYYVVFQGDQACVSRVVVEREVLCYDGPYSYTTEGQHIQSEAFGTIGATALVLAEGHLAFAGEAVGEKGGWNTYTFTKSRMRAEPLPAINVPYRETAADHARDKRLYRAAVALLKKVPQWQREVEAAGPTLGYTFSEALLTKDVWSGLEGTYVELLRMAERAHKELENKDSRAAYWFAFLSADAYQSIKPLIPADTKTDELYKLFDGVTRPLRKTPTVAEQFAELEKELIRAQGKRLLLSPDHSNRVFSDLKKLEQQGHPKSEIDRLATLAYSLSPHLWEQKTGLEQKKHEASDDQASEDQLVKQFEALEQELLNAKSKGAYLAHEHAKRVFADIEALERAGYVKQETDRLRALATHLSSVEKKPPETEPKNGTAPGRAVSCTNNPNPVFTADISDLTRISRVTPPGMLMRGEVFTSHSYIWIAGEGKVPVYAPVDATLISGVYSDHPDGNLDYGLIFQVSCEVEFRLGHITDPIESIRAALPATPKVGDSRDDPVTPISFKAGDLLGYTSGTGQAHNWDFGVYNTARTDPDAQAFGATGKDLRASCPYDYFASEKQGAYRAKFNSTIGGGVPRVAYCDW